jgi:hypothetical protein
LKSSGGLNLAHGLINPRTPSIRCQDGADGIVRRIPHLFVGLQEALGATFRA